MSDLSLWRRGWWVFSPFSLCGNIILVPEHFSLFCSQAKLHIIIFLSNSMNLLSLTCGPVQPTQGRLLPFQHYFFGVSVYFGKIQHCFHGDPYPNIFSSTRVFPAGLVHSSLLLALPPSLCFFHSFLPCTLSSLQILLKSMWGGPPQFHAH